MTTISELISQNSGIHLDIGCGGNKMEGFVGMDIRDEPGVDIVHDMTVYPWPLPDECVNAAVGSHILEHIPPWNFTFVNFMNELWRVMKPYKEFAFVVPHGASGGFLQDPTHCNPCNEFTFDYFCPERETRYWFIYKPKPWRLKHLFLNTGTMFFEGIMKKLPEDWHQLVEQA